MAPVYSVHLNITHICYIKYNTGVICSFHWHHYINWIPVIIICRFLHLKCTVSTVSLPSVMSSMSHPWMLVMWRIDSWQYFVKYWSIWRSGGQRTGQQVQNQNVTQTTTLVKYCTQNILAELCTLSSIIKYWSEHWYSAQWNMTTTILGMLVHGGQSARLNIMANLSFRPPVLRDCPFRPPKAHVSPLVLQDHQSCHKRPLFWSLEWSLKTGLTVMYTNYTGQMHIAPNLYWQNCMQCTVLVPVYWTGLLRLWKLVIHTFTLTD